jgi:hypothetical protein
MKVIEILPRFERVKQLTWLRRQKASCLKWEFKRHLNNLRRSDVYALEYEPVAPGGDRDATEIVTIYCLHLRETELDCAPYSQRPEEWQNHKHPGEAVRIDELLARAEKSR